jgi:hypothetical protein
MRTISFLILALPILVVTLVSGQVGLAYAENDCSYYQHYFPLQIYCYYQLTVNTDPSSLSGQVTGGGLYVAGSYASFSTSQNIQFSKDTRYVFEHWISSDQRRWSGTRSDGWIWMIANYTVTAVYQAQYYLTATAQPSNAPSMNGSGWYNVGDAAAITVPSQTIGGENGTRLVFNGLSVDGNIQAGSTVNLQMNGPHTVTAQYKQQYYLTVNSDQGVPSGDGWYNAGTFAPISVSTPASPSYGVNMVFNGWRGSGVQSPSQSTQVMMDGAKTVTATWRTDPTLLYVTIAAVLVTIVLIAGVLAFIILKRLKNPRRRTAPN